MTIRVGKVYKTRQGSKAVVMFKLPNPMNSFSVYSGYYIKGGKEILCNWNTEGLYMGEEGGEFDEDIVAEWEEPKFVVDEPGYYRTAGGELVFVALIIEEFGEYPVRGFLESSNCIQCWKTDGSGKGMGSLRDLVRKNT